MFFQITDVGSLELLRKLSKRGLQMEGGRLWVPCITHANLWHCKWEALGWSRLNFITWWYALYYFEIQMCCLGFVWRWVGNTGATGDYPFTHHKLSVQYFEASAAQDRKLEDLVHTAVQELWRPARSELSLATSGFAYLKAPPTPKTLSGSSDPCFAEAYHLTDPYERRLTLHLKVYHLLGWLCEHSEFDIVMLPCVSKEFEVQHSGVVPSLSVSSLSRW